MGNVVLEAMACGVAVVAPRAGGIPNLLQHGESGLLYAPRDRDEAVRHTRTLLDDAGLRQRLGRSARQAIEERGWEQSVGRVRQVYEMAIREGGQPARRSWRQRLSQVATLALVSAFRSVPGKDSRATLR